MLQPLGDYIILRRLDDDGRRAGALIMRVDTSAEPKCCEVVAVGPGRWSDYSAKLIPMPDVNEGDLVLTHSGAGTPITLDGVMYHVVRASAADIMGVLQRKADREAVPGALDIAQLDALVGGHDARAAAQAEHGRA